MMIAIAACKNQKVLPSTLAARMLRTVADACAVAVGTRNVPRFFSTAQSNGSSVPPPLLLHTEELLGNTTTPNGGSKRDLDDGRGGNVADPYSIIFLHGLLGNGRNLKTFARNVVKKQQQKEQILESMSSSSSSLLLHHEKHYHCQSGILVDLPGHGKSRLSVDDKNGIPYSFERCVQDVQHSTTVASRPSCAVPKILVGHSWGGRLTLEYTARQVQQQRQQQQQSQSENLTKDVDNDDNENDQQSMLHSAWLLDTVPGVANDSVNRVLDAVDQIEEQSSHGGILDKKQLVETLTDRFKIDMATSQWLASSYKLPDDTGKENVDFGFDLHVVKDIFPEFGTQDFMGMVYEILVNGTTQLHVVRGGKNTAWTVPILNDLQKLQKDFPTKFGLHVLPKAGHWVHIDDQKGLVDLF